MKEQLKLTGILFLIFFKIGLFTFGGGLAMISLIEREFTAKRNWVDKDELMDMIAVAESTPGPIAINMATYVGYKMGGFLGCLVATLGIILPSFVIIFIISLFLEQFMQFEIVKYAFIGINCAVGLLILISGVSLFRSMPKNAMSYLIFFSSLIATGCILFFSIPFSTIYLLIIGSAIYFIYQVFLKRKVKQEEPNK